MGASSRAPEAAGVEQAAAGVGGAGLLGLLRRIGGGLLRAPRALALAFAVAWGAWIYWLSSGPIEIETPLPFEAFVTNLGHAPLFGLLALWLACALPRRSVSHGWAGGGPWPHLGGWSGASVVAVVLAYGLLDELHQARVPERSACLGDAGTDLVAAACVVWVAGYVGSAGARESGLWARLVAGVAACMAAALIATLFCG